MNTNIEDRMTQIEMMLDTILIAMDPKNVGNQELLKEVRSLCAGAEFRDHKRKNVDKAKNEYEELTARLAMLEQDYSFLKENKQ